MTEIKTSAAQNLGWLPKFYQDVGYGGQVQPNDQVFFAIDRTAVAGVVRLASEEGVSVLRGMQVAEPYRGQGIGSALLEAVADTLNKQTCFCLPYSHLEAFYASAGFRIADHSEIPGFLLDRKNTYLGREMDVLTMIRYPLS